MWNQTPDHIYVAGHRGWPEKYPENTLPSFRAALTLGIDMLELDIRMSKDRELMVIHDATVDRTTNGTGLVKDKTCRELQALDAGAYKGEAFAGTRIPTFEEFLDFVKDEKDMLFNFEFKEYPKQGNDVDAYETANRSLQLIDAFGFADRCVINIFDATLLEFIFKQYAGRYKLHGYYPPEFLHVTEKDADPYTYLYCACPFDKQRTGAAYQYLWERGVQPWAGAWVKNEADVLEAVSYHTPLITCNNPATILDILQKHGLHA